MKKITKRLFLISFLLAILASSAIFLYLKSLEVPEKEIIKVNILTAKENIKPRTIITKEMIKEIEIPEDFLYGDFITEKDEIMGKYAKETIYKDEKFHKEKIINNIGEELSLKIQGNNRAMSIFVNGESGISDLIKVGDYVDVIVYLPEIKESERIVRPDLVKMILQSVEVLAVDKDLYRKEAERETPPTFLVTLSVPVFEVEKLALAEDIGNIKLVLRPLEGDFIHETEGIIWQELVLDDFYRMKDLLPQYEVRPVLGSKINSTDYQYEKYYYYTIEHGDTLRKISENFYGDPEKYILIQQVNRIEDGDEIIAGTGIKIPVFKD